MNGRVTEEPTIDIADAIDGLHEQLELLREQLAGVIVGQNEVSEQLLIGMLCRGHCILQGMARSGEDDAGRYSGVSDGSELSTRSIHARFDARRHHGNGSLGGRPHDR